MGLTDYGLWQWTSALLNACSGTISIPTLYVDGAKHLLRGAMSNEFAQFA
jgi:hypothetical protein